MTKTIAREPNTVGRNEFIRRWMQECGITYDSACQLYRSMVSTFEEGVANGQKVTIGRLGALVPHLQNSRTAVMGFRRVTGGVVRQRQEYFLDPRIRYKFKIYKEWINKSHLNWTG
jgi:hypothetical protein